MRRVGWSLRRDMRMNRMFSVYLLSCISVASFCWVFWFLTELERLAAEKLKSFTK